ncbi:unnamed protein product, partial [Protopolystoma xenopodis]
TKSECSEQAIKVRKVRTNQKKFSLSQPTDKDILNKALEGPIFEGQSQTTEDGTFPYLPRRADIGQPSGERNESRIARRSMDPCEMYSDKLRKPVTTREQLHKGVGVANCGAVSNSIIPNRIQKSSSFNPTQGDNERHNLRQVSRKFDTSTGCSISNSNLNTPAYRYDPISLSDGNCLTNCEDPASRIIVRRESSHASTVSNSSNTIVALTGERLPQLGTSRSTPVDSINSDTDNDAEEVQNGESLLIIRETPGPS